MAGKSMWDMLQDMKKYGKETGSLHGTIESLKNDDSYDWQPYEPTPLQKVGDFVVDTVSDFFSDPLDNTVKLVENVYGIDIPDMGYEPETVSDDVSEDGFNLLGLVVPVSVIGLLFLL